MYARVVQADLIEWNAKPSDQEVHEIGGGIGPAGIPHSKNDCYGGVYSELNATFRSIRKERAWPGYFDIKAFLKCFPRQLALR